MNDFQDDIKIENKNIKKGSNRVSLGVHSMPKTSEKSFKSWFLLGGAMLIIIIALFLLLVI